MTEEKETLKLKLLGPVAGAAGETLQDTWDLVFGGFGNYVEKKRMVRKKALEDFKATLEAQVNDIPSSQLCEPPISVIGPALEASKYYFEEEEIRAMFASVVSASMDARVNSLVHPSFPTIIQQLSTVDAQNLELFSPDTALPLCEYRIRNIESNEDAQYPETASYRVAHTNVFLSNQNLDDLAQGSVSISTLSRLGLIDITYTKTVTDADYEVFSQTAEYSKILSECKDNPKQKPDIQIGCAMLTPLGKNLCTICFGDRPSDE